MHKHLVASSVVALFLAACSGGGSEAVTPESSGQPQASASAANSVSDTPTPPPSAASSATAETPKPAPEPGADLKIVPMKITIDAKSPAVEIKQDGSVIVTKAGKPMTIANIAKNEIKTVDGSFTIAVMKDNSVQATDLKGAKVNFDDKDALVAEGKGKLTIDDKGTVDIIKGDGTTKDKLQPKIAGFKPEGRRTAELVLMMTLMTMPAEVSPAPATTSTPPATPAPAPAAKK
jgi:hypothetical protein